MAHKTYKAVMTASLAVAIAGCSSVPDEVEPHPNDPFESFNRTMFDLNYDYIDPYLLRPASIAYVEYVPVPVRTGVANFLANLDEPASVVNNILMGKGERAATHFNRFWINSTIGLLGLIDVAGAAGIKKHEERQFGDMLGYHGVGDGPYVMVPGYGPITARKATSFVDSSYVPLSYLNFWAGASKWALEGLETRYRLIPQEATLEASPDPYSLSREVYLQRRAFKAGLTENIEVDEAEEDELDDFLDEL
ncbi:VacJ family lipoprotein [Vibrio sp. SCSIO 43136]|uniref:MlaA family lipoprotein n=1 Tax=Vibrio sp. SCSIO 43136 TaxID=2819101 RepID=UPI0020753448|nr:VacJ family lipoprotein [Vibrio sp. SCSIO 43136]USD66008.1 VacJ family lipoprotein [Vibrio sp. SCSIO 43136]